MGQHQHQGSQGHLLNLLDNENWSEALQKLVSGSGVRLDPDNHRVPRGSIEPEEWSVVQFGQRYCREEMGDGLTKLENWWVKDAKLPTWDLIVKCLIDGAAGLLLVEAKAHVAELSEAGKQITINKSVASPESSQRSLAQKHINHGYIGRCIHEAREGLRYYLPDISIDRDTCYQLSNRIATVWMVAKCGLPTALLYLGFTGDSGLGDPIQSEKHWKELVREHLKKVNAGNLPELDIYTDRKVPMRFCIGTLPAARQSIKGASRRA